RIIGHVDAQTQQLLPSAEGLGGDVFPNGPEDVEGVETKMGLVAVLYFSCVFWVGGQDGDGGLERMSCGAAASVDDRDRTGQFPVEDGARQHGQASCQVRQVILKLVKAICDFAHASAGQADVVAFHVEEAPNPVEFWLHDP